MPVLNWVFTVGAALGAGLLGAIAFPLLWAIGTGIIAGLLDVIGVHIAASVFIAAGPVMTVLGFATGVWWVVS